MKEQVYSFCREIPEGKVTTYREIAKKLGTKGFQAIGQILRCNPYAPEVPCHRVVKSDGSLGGFKGSLDNRVKVDLLKKEGVVVVDGRIDLEKYLFRF